MSDFGTMVARCADELKRSDLNAQIKKSIVSAIDFYEARRFSFNEGRRSLSTVAGTEYYAPSSWVSSTTLGNPLAIDTAKIVSGSSEWPLERQTFETIDDWQNNSGTRGRPTDYCWYKGQLRLYPVADAVYTVYINGLFQLAPALTSASENADTNAWMTDGEQLIRSWTKGDVYLNHLRNKPAADIMFEAATVHAQNLGSKLVSIAGSGRVVPTQF